MKAVRIHAYGGSDQLVFEDIKSPSIAADQILVKICSAGINPVDWKIREGMLKDNPRMALPLTLGQDFAGEVTDVGKLVTDFRLGDKVFGFAQGAYAEYAAIDPHDVCLMPLALDFDEAASVPTPCLTAWQALIDIMKLKEGQKLLVHGAGGGVGSFAVQIGLWIKAKVYATASAEDREYLHELGVTHVLDYQNETPSGDWQDFDAILDVVGGENLERSYTLLRAGGVLVSTVSEIDRPRALQLHIRATRMVMNRNAKELAKIGELIDEGILTPRLSQSFPLEEARVAQEFVEKEHPHGKVVLNIV